MGPVGRKDIETEDTATPDQDLVHQPTALAPSDGGGDSPSGVSSLPVIGQAAYARRGELARGGLGRIIEATDRRLRRVVALKELRRHSPEAAARFVREAMVTARLQHPGIVPIYEAGRWSDGEPFYAMKLVSGTSLAEAIAQRPTLDERLALIPRAIAIAETIAYAHSQRVIHRDLKPHNVMCGEFGETIVIDWGLAKDLAAPDEPELKGEPSDSGSGSGSGQTVAGTVMGTPAYMPPEQARGEPVDERADVYALGALLYHLLAGTAPYPSSADRSVLAGPPPPLDAGVPRDLAAIVDKAMAREPAGRYPTARELAEDLRRFQTGHLVSVREYGSAERLVRWLRRHRASVAVATVASIALAVTGGFAVVRVVRERDRANREAVESNISRAFAEAREGDLTLLQARVQLDRDPTATLAWLGQLPDARLDAAAASIAGDAVSRGIASHVLRLDAARVVGLALGTADRGWALYQNGKLFALDTRAGIARPAWTAGETATVLAATPDGAVAAAATMHHVAIVEGITADAVTLDSTPLALALDPTGAWLAIGLEDGRLLLRPRSGGDPKELERFGGEIRAAAFSPDGTHLAVGAFDGTVAVYRLSDRARRVHGSHRGPVWALAWAPDGSAIASGGEDTTAQIWTLDGAPPRVLTGHTAAVKDIAFDASGERVLTGSTDHTSRLWARDGRTLATLAHDEQVLAVARSADGGWWTAGTDHLVRRWDHDGGRLATWRGHEEFVGRLALSPDSPRLASAGLDGSVRIWDTALDREVLGTGATAVRFDRTGDRMAIVRDGHLWLGATGALADRGSASGATVITFVDGDLAIGIAPDGHVVRFDAAGAVTLTPAPAGLGGLVDRGGVLFGAGYDGQLWRWADPKLPPVGLPCDPNYVLSVIRVGKDDLIATAGADATVRIWHRDGRVERVLHDGDGPIHFMAASADGSLIAAGDVVGTVVVWQVADGKELARYHHVGQVRAVAFAETGDRFASAGDDRQVKVWYRDGRQQTLEGNVQIASSVAFSRDGALLASGSLDGSVRVWALATGASRVLRGLRTDIPSLRFQADGAFVATGGGLVLRWPAAALAPPPVGAAALRAWIATHSDVAISAQLPVTTTTTSRPDRSPAASPRLPGRGRSPGAT
jgi:WD40 repeat protein